mmetsp:Transcript_95876/g.276891  ORF Transcript_95876/g.276891 Transcript_95876/m.276891 type:complete len:219 (-) Transcript_95876:139-795(-)
MERHRRPWRARSKRHAPRWARPELSTRSSAGMALRASGGAGCWPLPQHFGNGICARRLVTWRQLRAESQYELHRLVDDSLRVLLGLDARSLDLDMLELLGELLLRLCNRLPECPCHHTLGEQPIKPPRISIDLLERSHVTDCPLQKAEFEHVLCLRRQLAHPRSIFFGILRELRAKLLFELEIGLDLAPREHRPRICLWHAELLQRILAPAQVPTHRS